VNASALITGGTGGFGVAIARRLQAAGYAVVLADIDIARGPGVAAALGATFVHCDVASRGSLNAAVAVAERHGPLKTVHLNAGIGSRVTGFDSISDDIYRRVMAVNVDGVWFGIKAALPALRRAGGGHVVVTASLAGLEPWEAEPAYSTAKHAAVALVRSVAPALAAEDIVVNVICPGFADTPLLPRQIRDAGLPLLNTDEVADAAVEASTVGRPGQVYLVLPGHDVIDYQHREIPKPGGSPAD
jgi:NAD(P)-dependent dehydrogenase (short-subunit alcohol dehydrogenase family)